MSASPVIAFIGFGEAAQAFVEGWGQARPGELTAYDRKTDVFETRSAKLDELRARGVSAALTSDQAVARATHVFSLVTAGQALAAARKAAETLRPGVIYFDFNSVAPEAKRAGADAVVAAGAEYVDVAVMSPVRPALLATPLLVSGPQAHAAAQTLQSFGFTARGIEGGVGRAATVKILRSVIVKGIEALTAECCLAAASAGVLDEVIASLEASDPAAGWATRADYNLGRMLHHGQRRAEEMAQAAGTIACLGLSAEMTLATGAWQRRVGDLALKSADGLSGKADAILAGLAGGQP